ncbi:MAG: DUF2764 family protein [Phaeodactylibacter sp.]|nr:DUF2764 family protein [Phaeodactylibacter sp.]
MPDNQKRIYSALTQPFPGRNYYYLIAGLPDMALEQSKLPLSLPELMEQLALSLHPDDLRLAQLIFLPADNRNLLRLLQKETSEWEPHGRFSREEMEEGFKEPRLLPAYMYRFGQAFKEETPVWPGMSWENQLARLGYEYLLANTDGFLHQWFTFENHLKNILAAWNIREYGLPAEGQLIGENVVTEAARRSHARDFGLAAELPFLDKLLHALEQDKLLERERAIARIKWNYIDELNTFHYFTVEVVLGYLLKWIMLDRWTQLDTERGLRQIGSLIDKLEGDFELPKQFALA